MFPLVSHLRDHVVLVQLMLMLLLDIMERKLHHHRLILLILKCIFNWLRMPDYIINATMVPLYYSNLPTFIMVFSWVP